MINGKIHSRGENPFTGEPRVSLTIANITEPSLALNLDATIDTGFTAHLTLPATDIRELRLPQHGEWPAVLANGEIKQFPVYTALVIWNGQSRPIPIFESESQPLLGMALLWNNRLTMDISKDGDVIISSMQT